MKLGRLLSMLCLIGSVSPLVGYAEGNSQSILNTLGMPYFNGNLTADHTKLEVFNNTPDYATVAKGNKCSGTIQHWTGPGRPHDSVYWEGVVSVNFICNKNFPCTARVYVGPEKDSAMNCQGPGQATVVLQKDGTATFSPSTFVDSSNRTIVLTNPVNYQFEITCAHNC